MENEAKHLAHTIGVELGLAGASYGAKKAGKSIASRPLPIYPGTNLLRPQPLRWGITRFLGRTGNLLETKVLGKIPIVGPLIDLFTPSDTIMGHLEEKRLLREARQRQRRMQEELEAQRRAREEAERRRVQEELEARRRAREEAERRRVQEAERRAQEEARRRQLALELARIRRPPISTVRPEFWPKPTRVPLGGGGSVITSIWEGPIGGPSQLIYHIHEPWPGRKFVDLPKLPPLRSRN